MTDDSTSSPDPHSTVAVENQEETDYRSGDSLLADQNAEYLTMVIGGSVFLILLTLGVYVFWQDAYAAARPHEIDPPLELYGGFAGVLGAFLSLLLDGLGPANEIGPPRPTLAVRSRAQLLALCMRPILIGFLFGLFVYVLMSSQLIRGQFLPEFTCKRPNPQDCNNWYDMLKYWSPKEPKDYNATIILCFISGFSQKLFANRINSIMLRYREGLKAE